MIVEDSGEDSMEVETEKLIGQNPRDSLILRRQDNLSAIKKRRRWERLTIARNFHDSYLRSFAPSYLASQDENIFNSLSPKEKTALSKICASSCWFKLICHTSILTSVTGALVALGITGDHAWFLPAFMVVILYAIFCIDLPINYIDFIISRRLLPENKK